jgi:hypothetical protein
MSGIRPPEIADQKEEEAGEKCAHNRGCDPAPIIPAKSSGVPTKQETGNRYSQDSQCSKSSRSAFSLVHVRNMPVPAADYQV